MSAIDAQGTTFTFDGTAIEGLVSYQFFNGVNREVLHRALSASANVALPGIPDFGQCVLNLYRDQVDPGQVKLQDSLRNRLVKDCVLTYKNGKTDSFSAFCLILPVVGSKDNTNPVNASAVVLRVSGAISST